MGLFGDFLGIFKTSSKAVDTAADVVKMGAKGIDAIWFTEEEKAENALKNAELKIKWGEMALEQFKMASTESSARSLSRRYLAWGVMALGGFLSLYALIMKTIGAFWLSKAEPFNKAADFSIVLLKIWWPVILAVGAFYFSVALIRNYSK